LERLLNSQKNQNVNTKIRCFIAVPLNGHAKAQLRGIQTKIRSTGIQAGWPSAANFHLTLKFLGDIREHILPDIKLILSQTITDKSRFTISFNQLGVFPNVHHPQIIWIGPREYSQKLFTLQQELDYRLNKSLKLAQEKKFTPHITLSRIRRYSKPGMAKKALGVKIDPMKISVEQIHLIKSTLLPKGAIHTSIFHADLKTS
jgi:2'-5' RNA ligase